MGTIHGRDRPLFFVLVLTLLALGNGFGAYVGWTRKAELLAQFPRLEPLWWVYFACPVLSLVGLLALWNFSKWGYELLLALAVVVLAIELYAMGPAPHLARVPIATVLLVAAVRPVRGRLHY